MPVRDWDKLRRYDRARSNYDPISTFRPRKSWKKHRKKRKFRGPLVVLTPKPKNTRKLEVMKPEKTAKVFVSCEYYEGEAYFERYEGTWTLVWADPCLAWMKRMLLSQIKDSLELRECRWKWSLGVNLSTSPD